jgi:hypothetical protein
VHGKVLQQHWEPNDIRDAQHRVQHHTQSKELLSDKGKHWNCDEWKMRKQEYVEFREVAYHFRTLAYFAVHAQAVLQQDMIVDAYPCRNPLCITPAHLYLARREKLCKRNRHLPPFDAAGERQVPDSQNRLMEAKAREGDGDDRFTASVNLRYLLNMNSEQFNRFLRS